MSDYYSFWIEGLKSDKYTPRIEINFEEKRNGILYDVRATSIARYNDIGSRNRIFIPITDKFQEWFKNVHVSGDVLQKLSNDKEIWRELE